MFSLPDLPDSLVRGAVLSFLGLAIIILCVRIVGLRSFSKMTSFDFVITLAMGSLLATIATVSSWSSFFQGAVAIVALMGLQMALSGGRQVDRTFARWLKNEPVVLMKDGEFFEEAMRRRRVTRSDVLAKLRGANVFDLQDVRAVVLETTGDISVMTGSGAIDPALFDDVSGRRQFTSSGPGTQETQKA